MFCYRRRFVIRRFVFRRFVCAPYCALLFLHHCGRKQNKSNFVKEQIKEKKSKRKEKKRNNDWVIFPAIILYVVGFLLSIFFLKLQFVGLCMSC
jgi:hypothetical protein